MCRGPCAGLCSDAWKQSSKEVPLAPGADPKTQARLLERLKFAYRRAMHAVFNTSFTTAVAFFATSVNPIMPISTFGIFAAICILMNCASRVHPSLFRHLYIVLETVHCTVLYCTVLYSLRHVTRSADFLVLTYIPAVVIVYEVHIFPTCSSYPCFTGGGVQSSQPAEAPATPKPDDGQPGLIVGVAGVDETEAGTLGGFKHQEEGEPEEGTEDKNKQIVFIDWCVHTFTRPCPLHVARSTRAHVLSLTKDLFLSLFQGTCTT